MYNWKYVYQTSKWGDNSKAEWTVEVFDPGYYYLDLIYKGEDRTIPLKQKEFTKMKRN